MISRLCLLLTAVLVATVSGPVSAAPSVDHLSGATAQFSFSGKDRATYNVVVTAHVSEAGVRIGKGTVEVSISRCGSYTCPKPTKYVAAITPNNFTVATDMSKATLTTLLFGKALSITWEPANSSAFPTYDVNTTTGRAYARVYRIVSAQGKIAGRSCTTDQSVVLREVRHDPAPVDGAATLPKVAPKQFVPLLSGTCSSTEQFGG